MKPTTVRMSSHVEARGGTGARHRYALGGVALALSAGLGTPALARTASIAWHVPIETALVSVGFFVALGFLAAGWILGSRVDTLSDEARQDPVTKVGNRRRWNECLAHEVDRATRAKMPLSLLMIDIDHLKRLNDGGGHGAGDRALSIVGEVLNDTCRARDIATRFGGDEFAVLLPRTRAAEARIVAERLRKGLTEHVASHPALTAALTVSIGICDLASLEEPNAQRLFDAADRALYIAKRAGRDRVEIFESGREASVVIVLDERRRARKKKTTLSSS